MARRSAGTGARTPTAAPPGARPGGPCRSGPAPARPPWRPSAARATTTDVVATPGRARLPRAARADDHLRRRDRTPAADHGSVGVSRPSSLRTGRREEPTAEQAVVDGAQLDASLALPFLKCTGRLEGRQLVRVDLPAGEPRAGGRGELV